ncbi:MAG: Flp pilus assembly complex ATPase component TadA [Kiritimatiellae bacterium]|nr:Flp pilus assembly complex ATPase component TadA [Kiritimatiellia bacterium]
MSNLIRIEIRRPDKEPSLFDVGTGVYTIGSETDCPIRLAHPDIAARHAILTIRENSYSIDDLGSDIGVLVDDKRIDGHMDIQPEQLMIMGEFGMVIHAQSTNDVPDKEPAPASPAQEPAKPTATPEPAAPLPTPSPQETPSDNALKQLRSIKQQIHKELVDRLDIKRLAASRIDRAELNKKALTTINSIVSDVASRLPPGIEPKALAKDVYDEALGLGPLEEFLADPEVTEIMVNGHNQIYVERSGKLVLSPKVFMDNNSVLAIIERIVSPIGRRIDESQPYVDARLPDGSRVNAIINPLSLIGPCITIRKFSKIPFTDKDMIGFGTFSDHIAEFIKICVVLRKNIIVSGGTGSGKTTLLNVLSAYIPDTDRIITIEDAAELRLKQSHTIRLESRPPNIEGRGAITIRDLVRNALRMRPDRIVIGECRGGEALDMLQAMNTGHDGSITTVHANTPRDVISRLETMVLMSGMELPVKAIREQVASAIHLIVHESRFSDGTRKITKVTELVGLEGEQITMQDIFEYVQTGVDEDGRVQGHFRPTGAVPTFLEEIYARGLTINRDMFDPRKEDPAEN